MNKENVWGKNLERCVDKFTPQGVEVFICTFLAFFSVVASSPNPQVSEYHWLLGRCAQNYTKIYSKN